MAIGDVFEGNPVFWYDVESGYKVIKPIREDHNRHMYFTSNPFTEDGKGLIVSCIRDGRENYYLLDYLTGKYKQLTDADGIRTDRSFYDRTSDCLYYGDVNHIYRVGVHTGKTELIYSTKEALGSIGVTCDGKNIVSFAKTSMTHHGNDADDVFDVDLWRIFKINVSTGEETTIAYRNARIDHVQCHPTDPDWFMYCLWGYQCTHQRIWRCNISGTQGGPVGTEKPNEHRTHEFYTSSGRYVAFHGKYYSYGNTPEFKITGRSWGMCDCDGKNEKIYLCRGDFRPAHSIMSHDESMIVADGNEYIMRITLDNSSMTCTFTPLTRHASTMSSNFVHPHPSFSRDDRYIVFATDSGGRDRGNIYLIDLNDKKEGLNDD